MEKQPLQFREGHLFVELEGDLWLLDTGSPCSFGTSRNLIIDGMQFSLDPGLPDLAAKSGTARRAPTRAGHILSYGLRGGANGAEFNNLGHGSPCPEGAAD